jgi:hypothetical protein
MSRTRKLLAALAVAAVAAVGVSAFTASNAFQPGGSKGAGDVAGYGSVTVAGVTAHSISYTTPGVGDTITEVNLSLVGDTTNDDISLAFNGDDVVLCSDDPGHFAAGFTTYDCNVNQDVTLATALHIVATNKVNP